ncbi:MAG: metallophosphoesterase [Anaerolineales bacterium]|nr:metallophosphoesterase [Anaerolineales bacterium]
MRTHDFSERKWFPGTTGGPFHILIELAERIERLPWPAFAVLLLVTAVIPSRGSWTRAAVLLGFFLADWALIAALPGSKKSFGPAKPPAFLMALLRLPFAYLPSPWFLFFQGAGTLLALYAYWIEPHRITLSRQVLRSPQLPPGPPLRILHLADLHLERITRRERELQNLIRNLRPDLILFSGDFLNLSFTLDPEAWADARALIAEWRAPLGTYAVSGSPPVDLPEVLPHLLEGYSHIRCLHGEKVTLRRDGAEIDLIGLDCTHRPYLDGPRMLSLLGGRPPERFTILLYHSPDLAPEASLAGVDLMLSGHTHGGQIRIPMLGAVYTSSLYGKRFEAGRYLLEEMTLYVSRGIGMEGMGAPRVRFLCPPEVILWEIGGTE